MSQDAGFQRQLGLFDGCMLVAGSMIGSGIFIVSASISREMGSTGWLLAAWVISGVMTLLGALAYAELAAMMPQAGGQYVYLREAFAPLFGFLYGWTAFVVIQTGTIAAVAVAFTKFLGVLVPSLNESRAVAVALIVGLTLWNCLGVREGKWLQNIFTVAKIASLALLIGVAFTIAFDGAVLQANFTAPFAGATETEAFSDVRSFVPSVFSDGLVITMVLGGALVGSLFSSDAWNNVTFTAGEFKNPAWTLPWSLVIGTSLVTGLYLLVNIAYLSVLPLGEIANAPNERVGTAVMTQAFPGVGPTLMAVAIMVSTFGCMNGMILMGARLYYAMARDGLFFQAVGRLNRHGVPQAGLIAQAIWTSLLIFSGSYGQLLDYVICAALLFYGLTVAGLFVLRWRRPTAERPYRALGYPMLPAIYILACAVIVLDLLVVKADYAWRGFVLVLAGVPVYVLWRSLAPAAARSGEER